MKPVEAGVMGSRHLQKNVENEPFLKHWEAF